MGSNSYTLSKTERLNLRIDAELKRQVQEYCERAHTSLSSLVTRFFVRTLEVEREVERENTDAEQI